MSNLLKDASILLTPTAYDNGSMHAIKPDNGDGDFDFQRNSAATRVNAQGLVENVQIISSELITNGDFSNGSTDWNLDSNWSIGNDKAIADGTQGYITQTNVGGAGVTSIYKVQWTQNITAGTRLRFFARNYNDGGNITILSITRDDGVIVFGGNCVGSGTFTAYVSSTNGYSFKMLAENGVEADITNVSAVEFDEDTNLPRIDYTDGCGSWLIEPQSTNLFPYSEDFSVSDWYKGRVTINSNQNISPDGTLNASKMIETTGGGNHQITKKAHSVNGSFTNSVFAKKGENNYLILGIWDGSSETLAWFDLENGLISTVQGTSTQTIEKFGDYYRCSVTFNISNNGGYELIGMSNADGLRNYTGDGTSGVYIWGAQAENQSYATSYIPTNGAINTRLQDIANNSGNSSLINSTEGVFYAEIKRDTLANTFHLISLNNASSNSDANSVTIGVNGGEKFFVRVKSPNGSYTSQGIPMSIGDFHKVAIRYEQGNIGLFIDGTKEDTFTGAWLFTLPLDNLSFDYNGDGTLPFYGKTKALVVYKEALTDASLKSLTYPNPVATTFDLDFDTIAEQFTFTRGSEATFVNAQGLIESTASNDAPRIDYSTGEEAFLLEPQSTNLVVNSNDSFVINSGNILYNNAISPDGTQNAYRFESSGTSGAFVRTANVAFSTTSSFSVFLKYGNNQWYQIINSSATGFYANVDIQNGVFGTSGSQTENLLIKDYGNGWYRVSGTFTNASGNGTLRVYASSSGSSSWAVASASIGSYNYGYGFQVENQSYSTSYIPTSGAIATRNQELCVDATPVINSEEGTLYAEVSALADDGTTRIISLSEDGNLNNRINMFYTSGSNKMKFVVKVNGSNVFDDTITLSNILDYNKVALRYGANNFAIYINGVKESEQLIGSTYPSNTLDKLNFDQGSGNYEFFGNTKDLKYYPKALADVQLEDLTTI